MRHAPIDSILRAVAQTPWLILPSKLDEICAVLQFRANGGVLSEAEIKAAIGEPRAATDPAPARATGVAIIPVMGIVAHRGGGMQSLSSGGTVSTIGVGRAFDEAMASPDVGSILLEVDSPGGTVNGVAELADKIFKARDQGKKIVAIANTMAASAAYWIASAAHEVVSAPTGMTGSIGVYAVHVDDSGMDEQMGIKRTVVKAGKFKAEGLTGPLSEEATAALQQQVDDVYAMFTNAVAKHRGVSASDVRNGFGEGRALLAERAKDAGLVDRIDTIEETIARMGSPRRAASIGRQRAELERKTTLAR